MKILFSGHHNPHFLTITEHLEKAIASLGHDLFVFEDRQHLIPGRIRARSAFLHRLDLNIINRKLLALAKSVKPDIAIVTGGNRIAADTICHFKRLGIASVLWTTDPPLHYEPLVTVATAYDAIFCQGTEAIELLARAGIRGARWLPMACDPEVHHPVTCSAAEQKKYGSDIVFVGSHYPDRADLFEKLVDFDLAIWGPGWDSLDRNSPLRRCICGGHTTPAEWLKIYSASKIILATHYHDPQDRFPVYQASPRVFEAMACGGFLMCDAQKDMLSLFDDGKHLVVFKDAGELREKITHYLTNAEKREIIARTGREEVISKHTYRNRMEEVLRTVRAHGKFKR